MASPRSERNSKKPHARATPSVEAACGDRTVSSRRFLSRTRCRLARRHRASGNATCRASGKPRRLRRGACCSPGGRPLREDAASMRPAGRDENSRADGPPSKRDTCRNTGRRERACCAVQARRAASRQPFQRKSAWCVSARKAREIQPADFELIVPARVRQRSDRALHMRSRHMHAWLKSRARSAACNALQKSLFV